MKVRADNAAVLALAASLLLVSSAFGAKVTKLPDDAFAPLRASVVVKKIRIDRLPIYDNTRAVIDLDEFQVWAPGAKVVIHGDNGKVLEKLDPPPKRFFRGLVNGDPESFAFFSMDPSGQNVEGLIVTRDKKFAVRSERRSRQTVHGHGESEATDAFLTEYDELDLLPESGQGWQCEVDKMTARAPLNHGLHATGANGLPVRAEGISGTQEYAIAIGIETDFELYQNAGSNSTTLTNYVTNLSGAVSTIYNRDLKTNVTQLYVNVYTSSSDPWSAATADAGLRELGDYYHTNHGGPVGSGDIMLSGKSTNSGIGWEGAVCTSDFLCSAGSCGDPAYDGHYAGPYAWAGSIITGTVPDPDSTQNGVLYGMPNNSQYWPLLEYAHEFGHVMAGHHTHCIALTAAEQLTFRRNYVDQCFGTDAGCYSGLTTVPTEKGTIMSYCHLISSGGFPQSRYTFGQAIEASHHEQDDYMLRSPGPVSGFTNIVSAVGSFTISAITAPSSVPANSTGNTGSISPTGGTYAWTLTNGIITAGATTNSVTFTAGSSGTMTLRATSYAANGCGVTDTKTIVITPVLAPTNVTAKATTTTNVHVTWTAATGATSYHVYRSSNGSTYSLVGSPTNSPFDDSAGPPAIVGNTSYLYKVRSFNGTSESGDSNLDVATTVIPVNGTLTPNVSTIQAQDIIDARTAVNALRKLANNGVANPGTYTDPTLNSTVPIKAVHITELRGYIDTARSTLFLSPMSYTDPTITGGVTPVKAAHVLDLRAGVE